MRRLFPKSKFSLALFVAGGALIFGLLVPFIGCAQHPLQSEKDLPETLEVIEDEPSDHAYPDEEQPR